MRPSGWRQVLGEMDWWFVVAVVCLVAGGLLALYSASHRSAGTAMGAMPARQLQWILAGGLAFVAVVLFDYRRLAELSPWFYAGTLVLLVLVLFMGKKVYGAYRWLSFFGLTIQPSEFAKLSVLLVLAAYLGRPSLDPADPRVLLVVMALVAVPFLLIRQQPDLGTALTLAPLAFVMLFVAGVPLRYLGILVLVALVAVPVVWFTLGDYQRERVMVFFDPSRDPLGSAWNKIQSEIAVGSGGLTGKGYLQGTQNVLGFLPRTVAPTDFIFPVIAEETGFVGSATLLGLFGVLVVGGLRAALEARDKFGRLLAAGMVTLLFVHVFVNIAMTIGLLPITGIPLPLVSYGGSFMVCTLAGLGLVQSVYVRRQRR